ncbi:MAG: glutamate--tRNA ligase family protein [Lacibacter sp.]
MASLPVFKRTRYAPTPSGYLHLGNVVSFVLTAGLAQRFGARILLRIDDLDADRVRPEYLADIFETLRFLNLPWHEGPQTVQEQQTLFSQHLRLRQYYRALDELQQQNLLFACQCSRSQLAAFAAEGGYPGLCEHQNLSLQQPGVAWRFKTPADGVAITMQLPGAAAQTHSFPLSMRGFAVRGKNGMPAYQLASVMDDAYFGVDLIVRGADLLPSSLAQLYLAGFLKEATGFRQAAFFHHPLLHDDAGQKLSKSAGATSIHYLRRKGYSAAAVFTEAARMCGIAQPVQTWQELFALLPVTQWLHTTS